MDYMGELHLAENLARLRREKKITQESLAEFMGVTKASVSKWETGQSVPDVMLLPGLAAYFDVTVDELIGYQSSLSKQQIQKLYQEFAADFARQPFEEVMEKTRVYVKKYYSCYPFLIQICVLWMNHFMLAGDERRQKEVLQAVSGLCSRIADGCKDLKIRGDAVRYQAFVCLQLGQAQEAVEILEEMIDPAGLAAGDDAMLARAYLMLGNAREAEGLAQIAMYKAVLSLTGTAGEYLAICAGDTAVGEETIARVRQVTAVYEMESLHPNIVFGFEYQAALFYAMRGAKRETLDCMERCVKCVEKLFISGDIVLHGDRYFDKIEKWFEKLDGGSGAPRNREVVLEDARKSFDVPPFFFLENEREFERLKERLANIK